MNGITELLFGRDGRVLLDLVLGQSREEDDAVGRTRRSQQWCGSTPGNAPTARELGRAAGRPRPVPRRSVLRDF